MKTNPRLSVDQLIHYGIRLAQDRQPVAARRFFQKALERDPDNVPALLWLASISETAQDGYVHLAKALQTAPANARAHAALRWNHWREQNERLCAAGFAVDEPDPADRVAAAPPVTRSRRVMPWLAIFAALLVMCSSIASIYLGQPQPVSATTIQNTSAAILMAPAPTALPPPSEAAATVPPTEQPTVTPALPSTEAPTATPTLPPTASPTATALPPTATPEPPAPTLEPPPTATPEPVWPTEPAVSNPTGSSGERWIDVDLSQQRLVAYEGDAPVYSVIVSTGLPGTPTVTGQYRIYVKYPAQTMSGPGYYLPDVPYVMYFYLGYGIHGTYWHNNFGQPMSHGCVNTPTPDAQWLYNWAEVGTLVNVHY
jgi:lipoprotein-anchoring transpeptidase ErfK/SrfK